MHSILQQILANFERPETIKFRDEALVENRLTKLSARGPDALQVIADFDMTLTRYHLISGKTCSSTMGALRHVMPEDVRKKKYDLFEKYHPIEICHELSVEEKIPHMIAWYRESHELTASVEFYKSQVEDIAANSTISLRDNCNKTLHMLNEANVPVLIISAGCGDVLQEVLRQQNSLFPNKRIAANFMDFNEDGRMVGFKAPLIHTFNKNKVGTFEKEYFQSNAHRTNVILLGDSTGDSDMDAGVENPDAVLKIGFLNIKIEERLPSFLEAFDIVILNDSTMDFVNLVLKYALRLE